jgi:aryl-alcohol dehydrogenase-like predicted oxidoreductase
MNYRKVGKSGLIISEVSLGSWQTFGSAIDVQRTKTCVERAFELGINSFDTADVYGYGITHAGAAEELLGKALSDIPRHQYALASKAFWPVGEGQNEKGLSRKHIFEACNFSLKRLNTDYMDIFYCHRFDPETPLEETLMALDDLVKQGKILYIGVSEWTAAQITEASKITKELHLNPIIINQPCYNMLKRDIEKEIIPVCATEGIGLAVWSPVAQGVLTGKYVKGQTFPKDSRVNDPNAMNPLMDEYLTDANLNKVAKLKKISDGMGIALVDIALAWILAQKAITSVIIGASRPEQIDQNVKAIDIKLDAAVMKEIDAVLCE